MTKKTDIIKALGVIALILTIAILPALFFTTETADASESIKDETTCSNQHAHVDFGTADQGYITINVTMDVTKKSRAVLTSNSGETTFELPATHESVLPLTNGSGKYSVTVYNQDDTNEYQQVLSTDFSADISDETAPYLQANAYVYYEYGDDVQFIAEELALNTNSDLETANAFADYVTSELAFEPGLISDQPEINEALNNKTASNVDATAVFTAMCRTQNIPCQMHLGVFNNNQSRAWAEVCLDGNWVRYDFMITEETVTSAQEIVANDNNYNTTTIL